MLSRVFFKAGLASVAVAAFTTMNAGAPKAQFAMCGERAQIIEQLKNKYQETRQATGLIATNGAAELYISQKGTWTMLVTVASGKSCIIAAGHSWDSAPTLAQGTGI